MRLFTASPAAVPIDLGNWHYALLLPYQRHPCLFEVVYHRVLVGCVLKRLFPHRTEWQCATCDKKLHNRGDVVQHHVFAHFAEACQQQGVNAPAVLPVGFVPDHSTRSRMPWRVEVPQSR